MMIFFFKTPTESVIATQADHQLSEEEVQKLCWLYGGATLIEGETLSGQFIGPRREMVTPWSTNAVEITQNMAMTGIKRIEEYYPDQAPLSSPEGDTNVLKSNEAPSGAVGGASHRRSALYNVSFFISSGQTIGVIGGTGSGKSTLVNLISRLYDTSKGEVLVGGRNVKDYDLTTLRNAVSVVLQQNTLFSGTVMDNLRWGKPDATVEECREACRMAQADDFIMEMPQQYDTPIAQGGTNVSGGQKQRLCIARALLKQPKILILDDSTSACDTRTDARIQQAFREQLPTMTKLIIAQRISSVEKCDKILVMDNGVVTGFGTHDELLATNALYKEIYDIQTQDSGDFDAKTEEREAKGGDA